MSTLIDKIKEHNPDLRNVKAGRVAREYLAAIGAVNIRIQSVRNRGLAQNHYWLGTKLSNLTHNQSTK